MFADVTSKYCVAGPRVLPNKNKYYTSVFGRHVRKLRQNQLTPQEIFGLLDTDLYMAVYQTLSPPCVRVWLARLALVLTSVVEKTINELLFSIRKNADASFLEVII